MSIVEDILAHAVAAGASDVHLTAGMPPMMRVNGKLISMGYSRLLPGDTLDMLIGIVSQDRRSGFEEKGELTFPYALSDGRRFRVSAYRQQGNVGLAFRVVAGGMPVGVPEPEDLGIPECVTKLCEKRTGLVLVAGGAGSGRSTTLAALTGRINSTREVHIVTLEKPVEYLYPQGMSIVSQREIGRDATGYSEALTAALREDADVILVGEVPDGETACAVLKAAGAGCLVFAAVEAGDVYSAVEGFLERIPAENRRFFRGQMASVLESVVVQRLVQAADGQGRKAVYEVIPGDQTVRKLIREDKCSQLLHAMES